MKFRAVLAGLFLALAMSATASAGQVGQSRTIKDGKGNLMKVTLVKVAPSLKSSDSYTKPDPGMRFYGVFVRVANLSGARLSDCAASEGELTSKAGDAFKSSFSTVIEPSLACYKILPHRQVQGWIVFSVPTTGKPAFFDWTPDAGFGDATADFKL